MAPRNPVNFLELPVELICHILSYLCIPDLLCCTMLRKRLREVIDDSSRLQYAIELSKHRMVSIRPSFFSPSYASRLKTLNEREQAWKGLTWNGRYKLNLPPTGSVYEFVGGFYGNGREDDRRITASISFLELPSADSARLENGSPDLKMWTHPMFDIVIIDFTMDPSQDLLVLIALAPADSGYVYELHLRSLSTNEPHCKAPIPVLPCLARPSSVPLAADHHIAPVRVQVSGDLVALLVKEVHESNGAHLEIWDWLNKPQLSCKMARTSGIDDFTFLSRDAFLLARPTGFLEVYTFQNPITASTFPICQASYGLPPLSDGYMYWYITMSSNPAPGSVPRAYTSTEAAHGRGQQLYYPHPEERIHACCLYVFNPTDGHEHRVHSFVFFVNLNTLLHPPAEWLQKPPPRFKVLKFRDLLRRSSSSSVGSTSSSDTETDALPHLIATPGPSSSSSLSGAQPGTFPPPPYVYSPITYSLSPLINAPSMPFPSTSAPLPSGSNQAFSLPPSSPSTVSSGVPEPVPIQSPAQVAWSVWGPQSTRWFRECLNTDWQHSIYGLRTVESLTPERVLRTTQRPIADLGKAEDVVNGDPSARLAENGHPSAENVDAATNGIAISNGSANGATIAGQTAHPAVIAQVGNNSGDAGGVDNDPPIPLRHLRLRDFNPYSVKQRLEEQERNDKKGKGKVSLREPFVVTERSTIEVTGIFKHDITSWLPYVEVVSEDLFEVTDVMMDDCRLLLLRRGRGGRLRRVDVLTM